MNAVPRAAPNGHPAAPDWLKNCWPQSASNRFSYSMADPGSLVHIPNSTDFGHIYFGNPMAAFDPMRT